MPPMFTRRQFTLTAAAALTAPHLAQAQSNDLSAAIADLSQLHSLQVQRGDEMLFEAAPGGRGLDGLANIKSCSKSLVALLLGSVLDSGEIASLDATLGEVAPSIIPSDATDGVAEITMGDLVTLRAGLEGTSGGNYGAWVNSSNWLAYALRRPMQDRPGGRMIYSTGSTHILGAALAEATGQSLLSLARERLGAPLSIEVPPWTRDPQGYYMGGNEMALTPRGMMKLAVMMRDGGVYDGNQVLSEDWVRDTQIPRASSPYSGLDYGYGWFLTEQGFVMARGYGGQVIAAHPERDLAVVITSDPLQPARSGGYFGDLMRLLEGPVLAMA